MRIAKFVTAALAAVFVHTNAWAWSGPGHAAVAVMAYRELAADQTLRNNLSNLLKSHPKFNVWMAEFNATHTGFPADLDLGMFLFVRAATWPDEIRRTTDPNLHPFDHPEWHFVDYPLHPPAFTTGPSPSPDADVLFGIKKSLEMLADKTADLVQRAASLSWIIHLVGDLHQPLHCASLITAAFPAPDGDRGGNDFRVFQNVAQQQAHETTKLHTFWDGRLGFNLVPDPVQALQDAKMLKTTHPRTALSEMMAGDNTEQWSFESRDRATNDVYRFQGHMLTQKTVLPFGYITNSHKVARRRLALAGYRLSDELKKTAF